MDIRRNLYEEMSKDRIVIDYLRDIFIATDFYRALCNVEWCPSEDYLPDDEKIIKKLKGEKEYYWVCSWKAASGYIAEIRNIHHNESDDYMSFYCAGGEGMVSPLVQECFERMGWRPVTTG
jgi:hypothetical protein